MPTATNPQTGERFELRDGKWVPLEPAVPAVAPARQPTEANLLPGPLAGATSAEARQAFIGKTGKALDDLIRSIASGATGGYADEIAAALGPGEYEKNLASERERTKEISPYISVPGELAGGAAATIAAAPLAGATKVGQAFARLPAWLQTTGLGALWGSLYGSGAAEGGAEDRAIGAAVGAPLGAGAGAVLHGAAAGAGSVGKTIAAYLRAKRNPEAQAQRIIGEKMRVDETTAGRVRARLQELGPQASILDAAGENVLGLGRGLAGTPGPAKNRILGMLDARSRGEGERVSREVTRHLGPGDYFAAEEQFLGKLQQGAREAYREAYEAIPSLMTSTLERILGSSAAKDALGEAAFIAGTERAAGQAKWLGPVDKELTEAARFAANLGKMEPVERPGLAKGLSLETWDYVKRGLDSLLDKPTYRNELTGALNKKGHAINSLKAALVRELDAATGGEQSLYKAARAQYAGDAEVIGALREGAKFFRQAPEEIAKEIGRLSDAGKAAYRNGAARAVLDVVENTPDTASVANRLFNKSMTRKKIEAVFPERGPGRTEFLDFSRKMIAEQRFAKTKNVIGAGSRTAPMAAETADVGNILGNVGAVVGSGLPGGGHALGKAGIVRRIAEHFARAPEEVNRELARMLTSRNRADQLRLLELLAPHATPRSSIYPIVRGGLLGATQQGSAATQGLLERR